MLFDLLNCTRTVERRAGTLTFARYRGASKRPIRVKEYILTHLCCKVMTRNLNSFLEIPINLDASNQITLTVKLVNDKSIHNTCYGCTI